jgi:hypothetical protein
MPSLGNTLCRWYSTGFWVRKLMQVGTVVRQPAQRIGRGAHGEAGLVQPQDDLVPAGGIRQAPWTSTMTGVC